MPKIDIIELTKELRSGRIRPIYIIIGEEAHLALTALREIKEASIKASNVSEPQVRVFTGREVKAPEVISSLKNVPLFGGRPLVIVRDAEVASKAALEELAKYEPIAASTLVVVATKLDGRSRFMQTASKSAAIIECKPLYMDKVPGWINIEVKRQGRQISQESAKFLAEMVGNGLGELTQAIERIILYIGDRKIIEMKDVEEAVTETHQHDVFELTDAVGTKRLPKALALLQNILENGESPILVLNMLARHFRILSKAKDVAGRMSDQTEIAKYLGVHPFFAKNYLAQTKKFSSQELRGSFKILHRCDRELKSSRLEKRRVLEKTLFELMRSRAS